ncbi:MAG: 50S ribosomal protein L18 [Spirochaetia bacterium]|nr:50S ribosomal protein L18 [Spirochaetia bacterium]
MNRLLEKRNRLEKRIRRVRFSIKSKKLRPRLVFNRSNRYLSCQIIDDEKGLTLCQANTLEKGLSGNKKNKEAATALGKTIAERAKGAGIQSVVFDRRGRLYHGRVKLFADAAREGGLEL